MNGTTAYALSKKFVESTADSLGSLKGAACTVQSITDITDADGRNGHEIRVSLANFVNI